MLTQTDYRENPTTSQLPQSVQVSVDDDVIGAIKLPAAPLGGDPRWLSVLADSLGHRPYLLQARVEGRVVGQLPLAFVSSLLFGRYLVSLPYLNSAGVTAENDEVARSLIDHAVNLADQLRVRHLELRHEVRHEHPALAAELTTKVHMRLALPGTSGELWKQLDSKVRNQVRKGEKNELEVHWGGVDRLDDFYSVFSRNMRDLGTPVYARSLFESILTRFEDQAEICSIRLGGMPIAAALLVHGAQTTEVPSASSLRRFNGTNANMFMYWQLLHRAVDRSQATFDFGRSSVDSSTFRFKRQWGAVRIPATWQYHVRAGSPEQMRPERGGFKLASRIWRRLPLAASNRLGPRIVRGIP